ncbi:hypothetical protein B0A48_16745 [Cryoendolithus antarcticus]|uniref:Chromatin modification-related protein EAF6 n=1 Tax=Cryoendolithus antarcticus TaxID=1507870 RepID=A0A1V8SDF2_9PEZI|nr:hypothetical protein B0A48_16745 [Cryoendolithus antarcticus]
MTENHPPTSTTAPPADQPGRPYYDSLRSTLRSTLTQKRLLDDKLVALEENIHKTETAYLEETLNSGNIVRGFDGWVKGVVIGAGAGGAGGRDGGRNRGGRVREEERVFSRSSGGWVKAQEGSESNTPSHAATPTGMGMGDGVNGAANGVGKAGNKKKRGAEREEEEEKAVKRGKVTYARD